MSEPSAPASQPAALTAALVALGGRAAPEAGGSWLGAEVAAIRAPLDRARFAAAFAGAGRRLGRAVVDGGAAGEAAAARAAGFALGPTTGADECGRAALLVAALAALPAADHPALVRDLIRRGEVRERQAVLRALAALPDPARFAEVAVDACRTNVVDVFAAIACDNPYPARWFAPLAFDQMVLKALFVGAPLARVVGLAARATDELRRMVAAYASERRAAGRPVPADATLILGDAS